MAGLHDRMPVILPPSSYTEWIEPRPLSPDRLQEILSPHPANDMEAYPVTTRVNRPANDDAECIVRANPTL
jgi:putative SOS response-associated peptidase YedK